MTSCCKENDRNNTRVARSVKDVDIVNSSPSPRAEHRSDNLPPKLQTLVYDILPWRKVPESDARSVISFYPNLSEGADRVGGQLRGDKECPLSGVTKSGRVWRKVPESDARSVL